MTNKIMNYFYFGLGVYRQCPNGKGNISKKELEKHLGKKID